MNDEFYIKRTFLLAKKGLGLCSPNPLVGCVIVKDNKIIAEGYHKKYGDLHAEADALKKLDEKEAQNAILYCNLEPCSFLDKDKKQPRCIDLIIKKKIKKVVISNIDPNPKVAGNGIKILKEANIEVKYDILKDQGYKLNEAFFKSISQKKTFLHLKIAQTLDGYIASNKDKRTIITDKKALNFVHKIRSLADGILIGINTALQDDPLLNVRLKNFKGKEIKKIILDNDLRIDNNLNLVKSFHDNLIIFTKRETIEKKINKVKDLEKLNIKILPLDDFKNIEKELYNLNLNRVLVEGGSKIISSFLKEKIFDKMSIFLAPYVLGNGLSGINFKGINYMHDALKLKEVTFKKINDQILIEGYKDFYK